MTQTLKCRTLTQIIHQQNAQSLSPDPALKQFVVDSQLPSVLYDILLSEHICFVDLETLQSSDINQLCTNHNLKIGVQNNLRTAIEQHQTEILKERYATPGSLVYVEKSEKKEGKPSDHQIKVVLIGDCGVGKSNLFKRYLFDTFDIDTISTVGVDFGVSTIKVSDGSTMRMQIWDTAGQERFESITSNYFRDADCIIICYGVDERKSFEDCEKRWYPHIDENAHKDDVRLLLVGCKGDVKSTQNKHGARREVEIIDAGKMGHRAQWKKYDTLWCECSAKTGDNIESVFRTVAEIGLQQIKKREEDNDNAPDLDSTVKLEQVVGQTNGEQPENGKCGYC
mmetsp:Transcript_40171/g.65922  ORF Transcript_40171/g.65922 Transcript_40171/m.65922 type:complete len:339 (-) Transcript_40171:52-1068(-)